MPEFRYAKGRVGESIRFITGEMIEFDRDYATISWEEYARDGKLQKLMDRTVENILTALIEVCGSILTQQGKTVESYPEALKECTAFFGFNEDNQENFAKLALQRNRLAHRYLNLRWQAISQYKDRREPIQKLLGAMLRREEAKEE